MLTVEEADRLADEGHAGQVDKISVPYVEHVRAVAQGLRAFGPEMVIAGLFHDLLEDTDWTAEDLRAFGATERTVRAVEAVTNERGVLYPEKIRKVVGSPDGLLVKIADNAHNSRSDRSAHLVTSERERLAKKYQEAREVLWAAARPEDVRAIVSVVNPELLGAAEGDLL